ncbi:MAG: hypothetical protein ACRD0S_06035 [Acidimicrobiales bacterium]
MKRVLTCVMVSVLVAGACGGGGDDDASDGGTEAGREVASPFTPAPPEGVEAIPVEPGSYNYSPAVMDEGNVVKAWWCSARPEAATDNIWYQEYDKTTKQWSNRRSVLQVGRPGSSDWDSFGVCHPSVIRGSWPGRAGGQEATYAMYYTSTNEATGGGSNNSTGVVFSADGITWHGQHDRYNPMIKQRVPKVPGTYGAGLPAAWSRGGSAVTLFWIDTTSEKTDNPASPDGYRSRAVVANSEDGIRFGRTKTLSNTNAPAYWKNDYALHDSAQPAAVYSAQAINFRVGTGKDDKNETFNFGLYRMKADEVLGGTGIWEPLAVVDTNLTGYPLNFEPGLLRTGPGNVAGDPMKDGLVVWFGAGGQTPSTWGLHRIKLDLNVKKLALRRYAREVGGRTEYWTTTGYVPPAFRDAGDPEVLGFLDLNPSEGKVPLYGCHQGSFTITPTGQLTGEGADQFVSLESCEPANVLGTNGHLSPTAPAGGGSKPLYACKERTARFVSNDAKCEGKTVERLLGHASSS